MLIEGQRQIAEWFLIERSTEQFPIGSAARVVISAEG
jgi:hypothetical protein